MTESLKDVLAKVKQQREAERLKDAKKQEPVEVIEEQAEEDSSDIDDIDTPEVPIIAPPKPQIKVKPIIKPIPVEIKEDIPIPVKSGAEIIVEEIDILQNNGVYRRELLISLNKINLNLEKFNACLENINKMLGGI